ncbi:hypothetical protein SPI_01852 [Niveomyces insectorum RCEF 264]|uniref:Uncharacterized protein n=1 Tax=Niveomyces insectorum RCEF 264 TaxID=1081102 RepID=A0A167ZAG4_9HYPO|nr:hypothetical protein SPI_01852 [Niveomyces insectorum RCEF 264]
MPKQYVLFGRLLPPITTRRITVLLSAVFIFAVFSVIFTLPNAVPTGPSLSKFADHKFSIPQFSSRPTWTNKWSSSLNPFRPKSHAPPRQKDDSHEGSTWFADWKWLSTPFSSSFTLDESRALLPPLPDRPPIYCYYDTTIEREPPLRDAESALLLTWRRAWWAQGFRPVILSSAEATNNPRYEELQRLKVTPGAKADIMRWLAWENMGGGLLSQYLVLPMGARDDPLLSFLRRGEYPTLTRWEGFGDGLFAGAKEDIAAAIQLVLANPTLVNAETFLEALPPAGPDNVLAKAAVPTQAAALSQAASIEFVHAMASPVPAPAQAPAAAAAKEAPAEASAAAAPVKVARATAADAAAPAVANADGGAVDAVADANSDHDDLKKKTKDYPFVVDDRPASIAFYDAQTMAMKYVKVSDHIARDRAGGLTSLNQLINAHLHVLWQNLFTSGIAVLKPKPQHTTHMVEPALELAHRLAQCSVTPMEASCPPNLPKCEPCVSRYPMRVHTPPTYRNTSTLFTVGVVPHPYTYQSVAHKQAAVDVPWLRRKSLRDAWLFEITKELLGTGVAGGARVLQFKRAVARDDARGTALWFAAEQPVPDDVDWRFGFAVPPLGKGLKKGESKTPVPGPERLPPVVHDKDDGPVAAPDALVHERELLARAKQLGLSKDRRGAARGSLRGRTWRGRTWSGPRGRRRKRSTRAAPAAKRAGATACCSANK